jgi:hypothetical protein
VPEVLLRRFAAFAPDPKKAEPQPKGRFDLDLWLAEHDVSIRRGPEPYLNGNRGARRWVIESCPWNNHADSAAFLIEFGDGAIAAGCLHNSCQGFCWRDFRSSFEPGYDPSRTYSADSLGGTVSIKRRERVRGHGQRASKAGHGNSIFDRVKAAVSVEELAGRFTELTPAGPFRFKGLCPLHTERTPSFHINTDRDLWHYFGACQQGGDVITLAQCLMERGLL